MERLGLAISGGGYRAAAWGLGATLAISDAVAEGEDHGDADGPALTEVASVSGGSLTNAWLGLGDTSERRGALARAVAGDPGRFAAGLALIVVGLQLVWLLIPFVGDVRVRLGAVLVALAAGVVVGVGARDPIFGRIEPWLYVAALGVGLVGVIWLLWLPWPRWARVVAVLVAFAAWSALLSRRGTVVDHAFARGLTSDGRPARMADLDPGVQRVLCTTELHGGHTLYLLRDDAYLYDVGRGSVDHLRLSTAVQCSANLPGAFPVRWLRAGPFRFSGGRGNPCDDPAAPPSPVALALTDGGVYDNMADEWHVGFSPRARRVPAEVADRWRARHADVVVIANASGSMTWSPVKRLSIPLLGELPGLMKVTDVMYDQTTSNRRRELILRFDSYLRRGADEPGALAGTLVHIATSPRAVPRAFDRADQPSDIRARAVAAAAALDALGISDDAWDRVACQNTTVGTQLWPLGSAVTLRLIHHAYVQTTVNLHVLHDLPLGTLPTAAALAQRLGLGASS